MIIHEELLAGGSGKLNPHGADTGGVCISRVVYFGKWQIRCKGIRYCQLSHCPNVPACLMY